MPTDIYCPTCGRQAHGRINGVPVRCPDGFTAEQIAAAERVTRAHAIVADHRNHEPTDDGDNWSAWNDSFQAADNERAAADKAYAALFAPGRVPDAREVLGE